MTQLAAQFTSLLETATTPPELGPGPRPGVVPAAKLMASAEKVLAKANLPSSNGQLAIATVLLWHDHLEAAHQIAQKIENADGSYVHGIMHRREPDYSNAKYWFRRVGKHSCYDELARHVTALAITADTRKLVERLVPLGQWDPVAFVDLCESPPKSRVEFLCQVQAVELRNLLNYLVSAH